MRRQVEPSPIGAAIAAKRKKLGLSQRQLAVQCDMNNATICKLEKDPTLNPDPQTLQKLSEALALDYDYLLTLAEIIDDDRDLRIIARMMRNMSDNERKQILEYFATAFPEIWEKAQSDGI